jgi:hypothetical protein
MRQGLALECSSAQCSSALRAEDRDAKNQNIAENQNRATENQKRAQNHGTECRATLNLLLDQLRNQFRILGFFQVLDLIRRHANPFQVHE